PPSAAATSKARSPWSPATCTTRAARCKARKAHRLSSRPIYPAGITAALGVVGVNIGGVRELEEPLDDGFEFLAIGHVRIHHQARIVIGANRKRAQPELLGDHVDALETIAQPLAHEDRPLGAIRRMRLRLMLIID